MSDANYIFGGAPAFGVTEIALERVLSSYRLYDPLVADRTWQMEQVIPPSNAPAAAGKRIWYRNIPADNGVVGYLCNNPGEFRPDAPSGPGDVILDPPPIETVPGLSACLFWTYKASKAGSFQQTPALGNLQEIVLRILDEDSRTYDPGTEPVPEGVQFFTRVATQADPDTEAFRRQVAALYQSCLFDPRLSVVTFSTCMALLQVQAALNLWIQQPGCFQSPLLFLDQLVAKLSQSEHRPRLAAALNAMGSASYSQGTESVSAALAEYSVSASTRHLTVAAHSFFTALLAARLNDSHNLGIHLPYTQVLAEEGFACTGAGLRGGVYFFLQSPDVTVQSIRGQLASGDPPPKVIYRLASSVTPVFPKWFARSLAAAAQTSAPGAAFDSGLKLLHDLEAELQANSRPQDSFEAAWLDQCLLAAARVSNDAANQAVYSARIAGRAQTAVAAPGAAIQPLAAGQ